MSTPNDFRVIITGGGIAGLTLANLLEKFDIDYVLLEAHGDMAPAVGASIGMLPSGLRIMDQIGCYEAIRALPEHQPIRTYLRDSTGKPLSVSMEVAHQYELRYGYPLVFFDRQWLLRILYDHLQHKEKVLVNKRAVKLEMSDKRVSVLTRDGETFVGDIIVGADGIYSPTRDAMIDLAHERSPGYFEAGEADRAACYYQCSFGIAQEVPGWDPEQSHLMQGHGVSQLVATGPQNKVYWFLFVQLPETKYGRDIPRYTKDDEAEFISKHANIQVTETVTFGQVFARRLTSTLTPIHEVVHKKWFYERIIVLGDSAHKPNPIHGMGGNSAIESVAELVNGLIEARDSRPDGLTNLSKSDIQYIFNRTQELRADRVTKAVEAAHATTAFLSFEKPFLTTILSKLAKFRSDEAGQARDSIALVGASRVHRLPLPRRPHAIPFDDELPARPFTVAGARLGNIIAGTSLTALFVASFTTLGRSVVAEGVIQGQRHVISRLVPLISPLLVFSIEGNRTGNESTPLAVPLCYIVGLQIQGIQRVLPVHTLATMLMGFRFPTGRYVPPPVAKALLPALVVSYAVPTLVTLSQARGAAFWSQLPPAVGLITPYLFATAVRAIPGGLQYFTRRRSQEGENNGSHLDKYKTDDVAALQRTYRYAFLAQAAVHVLTLALSWSQSDSISATLYQSESALACGSILVSNLYTIWRLRRLGHTTTWQAVKAAVGVAVGQVLVGSGATWMALWSWREQVLLGLRVEAPDLSAEVGIESSVYKS